MQHYDSNTIKVGSIVGFDAISNTNSNHDTHNDEEPHIITSEIIDNIGFDFCDIKDIDDDRVYHFIQWNNIYVLSSYNDNKKIYIIIEAVSLRNHPILSS